MRVRPCVKYRFKLASKYKFPDIIANRTDPPTAIMPVLPVISRNYFFLTMEYFPKFF
jgi:hypothetical protein